LPLPGTARWKKFPKPLFRSANKMSMDAQNKKIVGLLWKDGRMKLKDISKKVNLPVTTVFNRLKKMQDTGLVRVRAEVDWKQLGYGLEAFVFLNVDTSSRRVNQEKLAQDLARAPGVLEASVVTGSKDLILRVVSKDMDELSDLVLKKLRDFDGVASTETLVIMKKAEADRSLFMR